jgi:hypothetical protein
MRKNVEDTKWMSGSCKSRKERKYNGQKKKGQTMTYKTLHKKRKIEQHLTKTRVPGNG